jgi:hypothetical protein
MIAPRSVFSTPRHYRAFVALSCVGPATKPLFRALGTLVLETNAKFCCVPEDPLTGMTVTLVSA